MLVSYLFLFGVKQESEYLSNFRLSNPNISQWMQSMGISNGTGIHTYYADRILNIMRNISSVPIVWQDVWDEKVEVGYLLTKVLFKLVIFVLDVAAIGYNHTSMERCW